jgi:hypothetical protein
LTLRANGIVVTPDDCSVECSLASLISMDEEDFDAMPSPGSIFTESDDSEFGEEEDVQEREAILEEKDDEEEYVNLSQDLTDSDDEDFVDVCAEIEK